MAAKYHKIHYLGSEETRGIFDYPNDEIIIEEKMDGANFRFWLEDGTVKFGSRNVDNVDPGCDNGSWAKQVNYLKGVLAGKELDPDLVYAGEATQKHSLDYNWNELPPFIGFDIIHKDTAMPCGFHFARDEFLRLGLEFIKVVFVGTVKQWQSENMDSYLESSAYRQGKPEGIVMKNYGRNNIWGRPLFAKVVTEQFQEKKVAKFGQTKIKMDDTPYVVDTYVTEPRIRKIIYALRDEGKPVERKIMGDLIKRTIHDVLQEDIIDIWLDRKVKSLDFGLMAKLVPQKCLETLDKVLREGAA
jgi:hypothetical protein